MAEKITFGSIWANLSRTPFMPKSGDDELHMAPIELVANIAMTASGMFGMNPTTLSPLQTPNSRNECVTFSTSLKSSW